MNCSKVVIKCKFAAKIRFLDGFKKFHVQRFKLVKAFVFFGAISRCHSNLLNCFVPSNFAGFSLPSGLDFGVELFIQLFDELFNRLFVNAVIWLFGKSVEICLIR